MRLTFVVSLFLPAVALGWGAKGHRITGQVAADHLSPSAKQAVRRLLGSESLAIASNWPDEVRSHPDKKKYKPTLPLHFVEIPNTRGYDPELASQKGDLVSGIAHYEEILRAADGEGLAEALKFFVHLVGDIHQPLHVGNGVDMGANICTVKWFKKKTSLHKVWDSGLIEKEGLSYTEYTQMINHPEIQQIETWQDSTTDDWTIEMQDIRPSIYPVVKNGLTPEKAIETDDPKRVYCTRWGAPSPDDNQIPKIGYAYQYQWKPTVRTQLLKAGVRIAGRLNKIFTSQWLTK